MKHISQIHIEFCRLAKLKNDIVQAKKDSRPSIFLGGEIDSQNQWRENVRRKFGDKFQFLDPFDKNWDPKRNIYDELTGLAVADDAVFLNGGGLTAREQAFLKGIDKGFHVFESICRFRKLFE